MPHLLLKTRFLFILLCFAMPAKAQGPNSPVVKTGKGYVLGVMENNICVFKAIPYAQSPVGALRFAPSVEHTAWTDTLPATKFGPVAEQAYGSKVDGAEDCLTLNVYTPKTDDKKRAVVVWIHGGSMTNGTGKSMNGHAFSDKDDIVTVTINYRLGAFGFLYLGDLDKRYAASGNNGLLDCVMALKWIKQNIALFGGDPNRVTIMGESAGAKLLSAVLVSPRSKGLFSQFIAESGSVQCIRDTITAKNERARLLQQLGLQPGDGLKLLTLPANTIMEAQGKICAGIGGNSFFGPVYDGRVINEDAYRYAAGSDLPRVKALIGTNEYEGAAFIDSAAGFKNADSAIFKPLFAANAPMAYAYYLHELKIDQPYGAAVKTLTQYMYQMHSYRFAKVLVQNHIPVWMYRFNYADGTKFGAMHGRELRYIWNTRDVNSITDSTKKQLTLNLHGAWVAFIKTGDPNISTLPTWPNYSNATHPVMFFDTTNKVEDLSTVFDDESFPSPVFVLK
jgi:para-nitrobenzyl esterase